MQLTFVGAFMARTGLAKCAWQAQTGQTLRDRGHKGWEHGHTADVSQDANMATHTHTQWHDADKIKGRLTLWGNWIFIKYLWMSSSEWREESMPCKDWWEKRGEKEKTKSKWLRNASGRARWKKKWSSNKTEEPWKQINLNRRAKESRKRLKGEVRCKGIFNTI